MTISSISRPHVQFPRAGNVVLAQVSNTSENRKAKGKVRPVILIELRNGQWRVMGLTSKSTYQSGAPRIALSCPAAIGLNGPGFLWGQRLVSISTLDVGRILGHVDAKTVALLGGVIALPIGWPSGRSLGGTDAKSSSVLKPCNVN